LLAIQTNSLSKTYADWRNRQTRALESVSLEVQPGTIFGLLGRNGAGKTTLIKILLGLVPPDSGTASMLGEDIGNARVRRRVGYLPEQMRLPEYLKPAAFLQYMGQMNGMDSATLSKRIPGLLEQIGLEASAHKKLLKTYSKGMQQRVGLAQALLNDPELLFLDEPTEGLDPIGRKQIRDMLSDLRARGKTIFLNSHLLSEIELICDQVVIMEKGNIVRSGPPSAFTKGTGSYRIVLAAGGQARSALQELAADAQFTANTVSFVPRDRAQLNAVIDALRAAHIEIESVEPVRTTLEQSFLEVVSGPDEGAAGKAVR
jgi:ABC-2 type transport system ATP-binding protein